MARLDPALEPSSSFLLLPRGTLIAILVSGDGLLEAMPCRHGVPRFDLIRFSDFSSSQRYENGGEFTSFNFNDNQLLRPVEMFQFFATLPP